MKHRIEISCEFLEARGEATKILEATKETLDDVTPAIDALAEVPISWAVLARRNDWLGAQLANGASNGSTVVGFVGDDLLEVAGPGEQRLGVSAVMVLPT